MKKCLPPPPLKRRGRGVVLALLLGALLPAQALAMVVPQAEDSTGHGPAAGANPQATNKERTDKPGAAGATGEDLSTVAPPRFDIELQAPEAVRDFLLRHMDLRRFQFLADLDRDELERLLQPGVAHVRELLGTLGHFSAQIDIDWDPEPLANAPLGVVRLQVEPGPNTQVASVGLFYKGDLAENTAPEAQAMRQRLSDGWGLPRGSAFNQAEWGRAKTQLLRQLTQQRYPNGRIDNSLADVDAQNNSARLYLEVDSGAPVRLGDFRIEGLERYSDHDVRELLNLAGLKSGESYDFAALQAGQQRLAQSGLFESVFVYVDAGENTDAAPVVVQLREAKRQKWVIGIGGSTDGGARLSLEHTHHRVPALGWRAKHTLRLEQTDLAASSDWLSPLDGGGRRWLANASHTRETVDGLGFSVDQIQWGRTQEGKVFDRSYYLQLDQSQQFGTDRSALLRLARERTLSANLGWAMRRFDNPLLPHKGHGLAINVGLGTTLGTGLQSNSQRWPFSRTHVRWLSLWPIGASAPPAAQASLGEQAPPQTDAAHRRSSRLALRIEGGAVVAKSAARLPYAQLFFAGGDASVRGYGLRDIGVERNGAVEPGRYLGALSLEWQQPLVLQSGVSNFERLWFIDGATVNNPGEPWRVHWGIGGGLRYNSPVGPLQLALGYGLTPKRFRLHLNVGFQF